MRIKFEGLSINDAFIIYGHIIRNAFGLLQLHLIHESVRPHMDLTYPTHTMDLFHLYIYCNFHELTTTDLTHLLYILPRCSCFRICYQNLFVQFENYIFKFSYERG